MEWLRNILSPTPCTNVTEFICLEWLWFAWKSVPLWYLKQHCSVPTVCRLGCDLLENSYLCGISNNHLCSVVYWKVLWFAWKFVTLWYQQQHSTRDIGSLSCCDLLENSYLCGISNNISSMNTYIEQLWFAWKFVPLWYQQQQFSINGLIICCCDLLENSYLCGISNN